MSLLIDQVPGLIPGSVVDIFDEDLFHDMSGCSCPLPLFSTVLFSAEASKLFWPQLSEGMPVVSMFQSNSPLYGISL